MVVGNVYRIIDNDTCKLFRVYKITPGNVVYVQKIKYIKHDDMYYVGADVLSLSILENYLTKVSRKVWYKAVREMRYAGKIK